MAVKPNVVDLLENLATLRTGSNQCQITIANTCPPEWGIVIAGCGVKFFYRDNTDYTDGPRNINLSSGQTATFISNSSTECVFQFFVAMVATAPGEPPQTITFQDGVGPGECLLHETVALGPKSVVTEGALRSEKTADRLQLTKVLPSSAQVAV